jgi:phosphoribosylformylglycinamidine synthase
MIKFAVISFPGTNCESETLRAFQRNGMEAELVLWNDPGVLDGSRLDEFSGYAIAGGFSYEDRGRSGVVAAMDPIAEILKKEADRGKVVLGICNGAQVLVETGLIPGYDNQALGMALAWNEMKHDGRIVDTGFYNDWAYLKNTAPRERSAFNVFGELLHIPFAHGEGRFVMDDELLKRLERNDQILFKYADRGGEVVSHFPVNPNGARANIAALCNPAGNVMAMMPHPERDPEGNGNAVFQSIRRWIEQEKDARFEPLGSGGEKEDIRSLEHYDLEILVKLIITDNTERTIEEALRRKGFSDLHLSRYMYYGINLAPGVDFKTGVQKIMDSGELANFNKHLVFVKTASGTFSYTPDQGLKEKTLDLQRPLIACDLDDSVGESRREAIDLHEGNIVKSVQYGVLWSVSEADETTVEELIQSKVLYNPFSMFLMR